MTVEKSLALGSIGTLQTNTYPLGGLTTSPVPVKGVSNGLQIGGGLKFGIGIDVNMNINIRKEDKMIKFSISVDGNAEVIRNNIDTIIDNESSYDKFIFDITIANTSKPKFKRKEGSGYRLFFTRPLFYNAFKSYVYDLNFDFTVDNDNPAIIEGEINIKPLVVILIIAFISLSLLTLIFSYPVDDILTWLFYILIPMILPIYFFRQVKLFKKEVGNILATINKESKQ